MKRFQNVEGKVFKDAFGGSSPSASLRESFNATGDSYDNNNPEDEH